MNRWLFGLLLLYLPLAGAADWIIASPHGRAEGGASFELVVVAPSGEELPDELPAKLRIDRAEVPLTLKAAGPAEDGRRSYTGTMPATVAGSVSLELVDRASNPIVLVVARRDSMQSLIGRLPDEREAPLSENDPMYFVAGSRGPTTARFQISFKYRLFDASAGFGQEQPWLSGLYFGYTQNSLWDLSTESKPFRDTSYIPSFFWKWERAAEEATFRAARLGVEHESNGKEGELSRSINILFVRPEWKWRVGQGGALEFTPKVYAYLEKSDNADIDDYRGYVDWRVRWDSGGNWIATSVVRLGDSSRGSVLVDLSRRTRDLKFGSVSTYLHAQLFSGYGESILEYNVKRRSQIRVGFSIVP